jgi:hypothetical protein
MQHDFVLDNQSFPAFRIDLNNALLSLATLSAGATEPTVTYSNQLWADTGTGVLFMRDSANLTWLPVARLSSGKAVVAESADACTGNSVTATTATSANALNSANTFRINGLGVGTPASAIAGEIRATNNITAYYSDARLKNVEGTIKDALEKVLSLNGVIYTSNDVAEKYGYDSKESQVGLLAQEVQKILPQVVTPAPFDIGQYEDGSEFSLSGENYMTVRYERIIPLLVEAIKELSNKVSALEKRG